MENLIKTPDFRGMTNLEKLVFRGCKKLRSIDPSIALLGKLTSLNLRDCTSLVSIPNKIFCLNSLEILDLRGCSRLFNNQVIDKERNVEHLKILDMSESAVNIKSKSSLCKRLMHSLNSFYPTKHKDSTAFLLPFLNSFLWLRDLDLSFCNLSQVPDAIGWLHGLEVLNLGGNNFDRLPSSIKQLSKLTSLDLQLCRKLKSCPELPTTTILPTVMRSPIELYISNCPKLHEMECWNSVAFPWMLQVIQAQQESSNPIGVIDIFIPGSQIPRWYNIQSVGDSMNLDPSGVIHDSNWIVVSFCIAFPTCNLPTLLKNNCRAEVFFQCPSHPAHRGGRYYTRGNTSLLFGDPTTDKYLSMVKEVMDHLFIFYMTRENFISSISCLREENCNLDLIDFSFLGQHQHGETGNTHVYAKKHGLRWVYKQDLEQLKANKSSSTHVHDGDFGIGSPILSSEPANSSA